MKRLWTLAFVAMLAWGAVRVRINVRAGHPIHPRLNRTVVVRTRPVIALRAPIVYAPLLAYRPIVVTAPPRNRIVWSDNERMQKNEDWVDTTFAVNKKGDALYLRIRGRGQVDFAEVTFENGQVQVVDFKDGTLESGTHLLLDFKDGREVNSVRLIARAVSQTAAVGVAMTR